MRVCDVLWLNRNNGPTVSRLHWDSFLSPSLNQILLRETGYFRSTLGGESKHGPSDSNGGSVHLFDCMRVPRVSIDTSQEQQKQNLGVLQLVENTIEQSGCGTEWSRNRNRFRAKRRKKNKPALFDHLMRWQTAKSALSPVVASYTSGAHSVFLHYSSDFSWARLRCPASRASGWEHMHSGMRAAFTRC